MNVDQIVDKKTVAIPGPRSTVPGPRGLPGVNAVDNDHAVAAYIGAPGSATRGALDMYASPLLAAKADRSETYSRGDVDSALRAKADLSALAGKADSARVDALAAGLAGGGPRGLYPSAAALQAAWPQGTAGTYLVAAADGYHAWLWTGSKWTDLGVYQAAAVPDFSLGPGKLSAEAYAGLGPVPAAVPITSLLSFEVGDLSQEDGGELPTTSDPTSCNMLRSVGSLDVGLARFAVIRAPDNTAATAYHVDTLFYDATGRYVGALSTNSGLVVVPPPAAARLRVVVRDSLSAARPEAGFAAGFSIRLAPAARAAAGIAIRAVDDSRSIGAVVNGAVQLAADPTRYVMQFDLAVDGRFTCPMPSMPANGILAGVTTRGGLGYDAVKEGTPGCELDRDAGVLTIDTGMFGDRPAPRARKRLHVVYDYALPVLAGTFGFEACPRQYVSGIPYALPVPAGQTVTLCTDEMYVGDRTIDEAARSIRTQQGTTVANQVTRAIARGVNWDEIAAFPDSAHRPTHRGSYTITGFDDASAGRKPAILLIGESTSADPRYQTGLADALEDVEPTWLGTLTQNGMAHEAIGGDTIDQLVNSDARGPSGNYPNPFRADGAFSYANYVDNVIGATPDIVLVNYGVNDAAGHETADDLIDAYTADVDALIDAIQAARPGTTIILGLSHLPAPSPHEGYATTRQRSRMALLNAALIDRYEQTEHVLLNPMNLAVSLHDFNTERRHPDQDALPDLYEDVVTDPIHPGDRGYAKRALWTSYAIRYACTQ